MIFNNPGQYMQKNLNCLKFENHCFQQKSLQWMLTQILPLLPRSSYLPFLIRLYFGYLM